MKQIGLGLIVVLCLVTIRPVMAQEGAGIPITADTVDRLDRVGILGKGHILDSTWTQDGSTLIVLSSVGVWLYDANHWEAEPDFLPVYSEMPYGRLAYHAETDRIAAGGMIGTAWVWDLSSQELVYTLDNQGGTVSQVIFSADGSLLATQTTRFIRIWDMATGEFVDSVHELSELDDVTFVSSRKTGVDSETHKVRDPANGELLTTLEGYLTGVTSVAVNPDGTLVVSGERDGTLRLWDVASGQQLAVQQVTEGRIYDLVFSPDGGQLAIASDEKTVQLWHMPDLTRQTVLEGHLDTVYSVAFSPDGSRLASGSADGTVCLWEAGKTTKILYTTPNVYGLAFSPDGTQIATGTGDGVLRLWDVATGIALDAIFSHFGGAYGVAFSAAGDVLVTCGGNALIQSLEMPSRKLIGTFATRHRIENLQSVVISIDGSLAMFGTAFDCYDCMLYFWNPATGEMARAFPSLREVWDIAISQDGTLLATVDSDAIMLWGIP